VSGPRAPRPGLSRDQLEELGRRVDALGTDPRREPDHREPTKVGVAPPRPGSAPMPPPPADVAPQSATLDSPAPPVVQRIEPPQRRQEPPRKDSPPGGTPVAPLPSSQAERLYYAERARAEELAEELRRRPPRTPSEPPVSWSSEGLRIPTRTLRRFAPWALVVLTGSGSGYLARERLYEWMGITSLAKLETESAARRELERKLTEEQAARAAVDAAAVARDRALAAWLYQVVPELGVRVTLPPGVAPPEVQPMQPAPLGQRLGAGAAAPIQPPPLPMPPAPR
jgi:hypothetical protein